MQEVLCGLMPAYHKEVHMHFYFCVLKSTTKTSQEHSN